MARSSMLRPTSGMLTSRSTSYTTLVESPEPSILEVAPTFTGAPRRATSRSPVREPSSAGSPQDSDRLKDGAERMKRLAAEGRRSGGTEPEMVDTKPRPRTATSMEASDRSARSTRLR